MQSTRVSQYCMLAFLAFGLIAAAPERGGLAGQPADEPAGPQELQLATAVQAGDTQAVKKALREGARPNFYIETTAPEKTPLILAAENGYDEIVDALIEAGARIDALSGDPFVTALYMAAARGHLSTVRVLVRRGANLNKIDYFEGGTPLWRAASNGHLAVVKLLETAGSDLHFTTEQKMTTLIGVAWGTGDAATAGYLLSKRASIDAQDADGNSALMWAAERGHTELVGMLLLNGANRSLKNKHGQTALDLARLRGHNEAAQLMLRN